MSELPLGTDGGAGVGVVLLLQSDADVVLFPACSGWSDHALAVDELLARRPGTSPTSKSDSTPNIPCETEVSSWDEVAPSQVKMGPGPRCSRPPSVLRRLATLALIVQSPPLEQRVKVLAGWMEMLPSSTQLMAEGSQVHDFCCNAFFHRFDAAYDFLLIAWLGHLPLVM